ncbi:hypothetical protein FHW58_001106 [Duganella sp. 1224]|uniref:DUF3833 domain-containing protein n=1 Tax=Duganella sp. 1224 TaxID=2587052 RepID=UPI0015CEE10D|nr:DUF3833 domain-containing protein [Duganella sp. 1224]NYE59954.1 hypothetical protein [Duganella sp. 1224]
MKRISAIMLAALLAGCAGPDIQQYRTATPALDPADYFTGVTDAWGMFQKRNGEVTKRFHVEITGTQRDNTLTLDERFRYDDGSTQQRVWRLVRDGDQRWRGTAADVKGEAQGETAGNALRWQYTLLLPVDGTTYEMQFDDWMFLIDRCTMMNRASMRKFGIEFGQVTLTFRRRACNP